MRSLACKVWVTGDLSASIPAGLPVLVCREHASRPPQERMYVLADWPDEIREDAAFQGKGPILLSADQVQPDAVNPERVKLAATITSIAGNALFAGGLGLVLWPLSSQEVIGIFATFAGLRLLIAGHGMEAPGK